MNGLPFDKPSPDGLNEQEQEPEKPCYDGTVQSPLLSGEAKLTIDTDGLLIDTLFEQTAIPYADMESVSLRDYTVYIHTPSGNAEISRMGQKTEWFHRELLNGYHAKVLKILHIEEQPELVSKGRYSSSDVNGTADLQIFPDSLCILPSDKNARRIPFVFVNGLKKEDTALTISLSSGESYTLSILGYDLEPIEKKVSGNIRKQRENNRDFIQQIDNTLGFSGSSKAAILLPEGIAAQILSLPKSLAASLEKKARNSKMGSCYSQLKTLGDENKMALGIKALPEDEVERLKAVLLESLNANAEEAVELTAEQEDALRWILWAVIPSKDGKTAVVEFAFPNEDAATYFFHTDDDFTRFMKILNRAVEAVQLGREVFSLSDEELQTEKYADIRMAVERTPAVQTLRRCFLGRAIHRSAESWRKKVMQYIEPTSAKTVSNRTNRKFCTSCGAALADSIKFCGQCGMKVDD